MILSIEVLLASGAGRNAQTQDGDTVLHLTIKLYFVDRPNHMPLFKMLLDDDLAFDVGKVNLSLRDKMGRTLLLLCRPYAGRNGIRQNSY